MVALVCRGCVVALVCRGWETALHGSSSGVSAIYVGECLKV